MMDPAMIELAKTQKEQKIAEEYLSSLADLNMNSKPLINMLTMLAEENIEHAPVIVKVVEQHIAKVSPDFKLPILYLIDSIVKNVKSTYVSLFSQCIVNIFCGVFEKVKESIRERMYALRQTWNDVFAPQKLFALDVKVKRMDVNWPITAKHTAKSPAIHVNPNFLKTNDMEETLRAKTRELLELKKRKLELELEATKKHLEEQEKQLSKATESVIVPTELVAMPIRQPGITPIIVPGTVGANILPQQMQSGPIRPALYQNLRNPRPQQPMAAPISVTGMMNTQQQAFSVSSGMQKKPKVQPVNSVLLHSVRHRDPRLARQQQQQQQRLPQSHTEQYPPQPQTQVSSIIPMQVVQPNINNERKRTESKNGGSSVSRDSGGGDYSRSSKPSSSSLPSSNKSHPNRAGSGGSGSESKSPTRRSSSGRSSAGRPSSKNGSSGNSSSFREKDRNRAKVSSSSLPSDKRKVYSSSSKSDTSKAKNDDQNNSNKRDEEENSLISYKRKSTSPATSPIKFKDTKRNTKPRVYSRKNKSRSPSPPLTTKDVDLRLVSSVDKRPKIDSDDRDAMSSTVASGTETAASSTLPMSTVTTQTTTSSASAASKELEQNNLSAAAATATKTTTTVEVLPVNDDNSWSSSSSVTFVSEIPQQNSKESTATAVSTSEEKSTTKRQSTSVEDQEAPVAKKSKSEKLDALFGTEDVDLRSAIPAPILGKTQHEATLSSSSGIMTPPPPPVISTDEQHQQPKPSENWAKVKGCNESPVSGNKTSPKKSSLEDVRAKLAKAAKYNKFEKSNKELAHRLKIEELLTGDDTQECKDESIRTIITQAQEMLETQGLKDEQYQQIVHTVMSINEANKLMEAKRRESLGAAAKDVPSVTEKKQNSEVDQHSTSDPDKLAREAVLKKRIPKLNRDQKSCTAEGKADLAGEILPVFDEKNSEQKAKYSSTREKRVKVSKWGDRIDVLQQQAFPGSGLMLQQHQQQKPWLFSQVTCNNNVKRGFRATPGSVQLQTSILAASSVGANCNNNQHMPPQMPSPWQNPAIGSNIIPQFSNISGHVPAPPPPLPPIAPPIIPKPCNSIDNPQTDMVRTITIDGRSKEIRIYDKVAIVFMDWDQPREIGFQAGQRCIKIDNNDSIALQFNHDYQSIFIDGQMHRVRFGFPSRELYIDDHWYEVYFGGPPVSIPIQNKMHLLKAEGPPPQVNIGCLRRDLVVGKINLIVDALIIIPVFLDAKPQVFQLDGNEHVIQFADNLLTVMINGDPMQVEYGGLPKRLILGEKKYFVRFGALPNGIVPGRVHIKDMMFIKTDPQSVPMDAFSTTPQDIDIRPNPPILPAVVSAVNAQGTSQAPAVVPVAVPLMPSAINIDDLFQKLLSSGILGGGGGSVSTSNFASALNSKSASAGETVISDEALAKDETNEPTKDPIKPIDLSVPETIKTRQPAIVLTLYLGMQCSSCGVRFPPEQTIKYSQHLDWHFRQNRRERDSTRKAHSRKWYYDIGDWVQYEEIEDIDEREKNFFETQQNDVEIFEENSNQQSRNSPVLSCPAGPKDVDQICDMCQEKFEQFYNEELEEWHLRSALRIDEKIYHPLCYEDYKSSLKPPEEPKVEDVTAEDDNAVDIVIKIESDEKDVPESTQVIDDEDDDDDVIILPTEEPSITEIDDDEEYVPVNMSREEMANAPADAAAAAETTEPVKDVIDEPVLSTDPLIETTESDVEIQEPHIPFTDLDTYVEKELPPVDDSSQNSLLNVRIKQEPKEDEDEDDDDFEDVGTVVMAPDEEISIHSSDDNTQPQDIGSTILTSASPNHQSAAALSPRLPSSTDRTGTLETLEDTTSMDDLKNITADLEPKDDHNLSTADPTPIAVGSLVNRIKINIAKNIVPPSATAVTTPTINSNDENIATALGKTNSPNQSELNSCNNITISTASTIPVFYSGINVGGGNNSIPTVGYCNATGGIKGSGGFSAISVIGGGNAISEPYDEMSSTVSNISVVGNYSIPTTTTMTTTATTMATPAQPITPSDVEDEGGDSIQYQLKLELQKAVLKKMKKVDCGLETSGLCSIM